ncbi:hypothetical protein PSTT_00634 [Puccinia striiformis]|uniref:BRCA2 OB1 domain-containing protein n=3 Tax=Puccinia striiformis TaxID=27350 RepID=A0A2S4W6D0_9BASI|nr:hypothetical protein PSTT_00634 [Puccinia striiformis]
MGLSVDQIFTSYIPKPMSTATSKINDSHENRPSKRTRFSSADPTSHSSGQQQQQPGDSSTNSCLLAGHVDAHQQARSEAEVSSSSHTPDSSFRAKANSSVQDAVNEKSDPTSIDRDALPKTIHESPTPADREDSLTPLTETLSENDPLAAEAIENDLEISQYDIWSDCEQEELDTFDETDSPNGRLLNTSQLTTSNTIQDHVKTFERPDALKTPAQVTDQSGSKKASSPPEHQPSSSQLINPNIPTSSSHRDSNHDPSPSSSGLKRNVSSLFTTGGGQPFPMAIEQPISSPPSQPTILAFDRPGSPVSAASIITLATKISADNTSEVPQTRPTSPSHPHHPVSSKPRRTLSSLFQTGAGQPFPMDESVKEKSSPSSTGNQDCPVFGFQTARGHSVSAPSKESMRKALDICNNNNLSHFPKPHYIEPDSPSPSHRAKIQKASQCGFSRSASPSEMCNNPTQTNKSQADGSPPIAHVRTPQKKEFSPTGSSSMNPPMTKFDTSDHSAGLFSTGAGAPIHIPVSAVERARAHLDNPSQSLDSHPLPVNGFCSPLKDVSNLQPASHSIHKMSDTTDLLVGSVTRQPHHMISTKLQESLSAVVPKIPSQPTTTASLMSTPVRALSKSVSRPQIQNSPHEPITLPSGLHTYTAPVRRISNRMHIGLTPQSSSRRVSHESKVLEHRSFITPFKKKIEVYHPSKSGQPDSLFTPARETSHSYHEEETPSSDPSRRSVMYIDPPTRFGRQGSSGKPQSVFDLSRRSPRTIPMADWLASPKGYSARHLLSLSVPESVVFMTAKSAAIWTFNALTEPFGAIQALGELLQAGCSIGRSTPQWVANHWGLIVWKLSGMVRWQPDCMSRIWNPLNAVQQLKYRYEREFVCGDRSALKRILDNDCPSTVPMCLVIVGIIRQPANSAATKGFSALSEMLELSDGWYKIKAHLDPVLARVLKRGSLRVGFKLAISGASTEAPVSNYPKPPGEKKSTLKESGPSEEGAQDEVRLYLEGNATSRARWAESLGLRARPWLATLRSLTPDGGRIPMMDIVVMKVFPPMFVDQEGRMGRWGIEQENMLQVAWEKEREKEAAKIAVEQEQEFEKIQGVADLVASIYAAKSDGKRRLSGDKINGADESEVSGFDADDFCEDLVEGDIPSEDVKTLSTSKLVQLRQSVQRRFDSFRSRAVEDLQKTLNNRVPLRRTRHIQLLNIRDFQTFKNRPQPQLVGNLSVQDLSRLPDGFFKEGARYWVENLQPQRNARWDHTLSSKNLKSDFIEVPLSTRRDTSWRNINLDA